MEDNRSLTEIHKDLCTQIHEVFEKKNHDYGNSTVDTYNKYGLVSYLVRLEDKLNRARTLYQTGIASQKVSDEKLEDTLLDLANYALIALSQITKDGGVIK